MLDDFWRYAGMSSWLHAKTSRFSLRNLMSLVLISGLTSFLSWSSCLLLLPPILPFPGPPSFLLPFPQSPMCGSPSQPGWLDSILLLELDLLLLPDAIICWEFYLQTVGRRCYLPLVERGPPNDDIVGCGTIYHQEVHLSGQLHRVGPCRHRQCHYARVDLISAEADEWRVKKV